MIIRKLKLSILCLSLCGTLIAQTATLDSLLTVLDSFSGKKSDKASLLIDISREYNNVDVEKGIFYATEALLLTQNKKGMELLEARAHINLGNYYQWQKNYYTSFTHYKKAEKLAIKINNLDMLLGVYRNIRLLFNIINDIENEMYYSNKIREIAIEKGDPDMEIFARFSYGKVLYKDLGLQEALDYFLEIYQQALLLNSVHTNLIGSHCGYAYLKLGQPREALHFLYQTLSSEESLGVTSSALFSIFAEAYAMLQDVDSAYYFLDKSEESFAYRNDVLLDKYRIISMLDTIKGDYRSALENFKKFHQISDSISKAGKTAEIARMKNWHELEQKDNENEILQQEKQKQQRLILILSVTLLMIIALLLLVALLYRKTAEKNNELKKLHIVKDKLFSVIAHDLRSPIASLMTVMKLVNENQLDADMQAQLMNDLTCRVDSIYGLLDNLLRWAKSQMQRIIPSPVYFDAQEASREVTDFIRGVAESKKIILNNHIQKQQIFADKDMFAVLVRNLTTNAIKYTAANGEVTLDSELQNNMMVISVKDTGTGMPIEVQEQLFKLSETKSRRGTNDESGTGLGLVLCADFVKANGGNIWFTSKYGEGSTFFFSFPISFVSE
ncbi:MAG: HAMP domain-containing histidine kinase [Marinilabiliaceae bacterium]|nr:HAMP domain-containing histidine kinase [Marinilabiliaceae bacterium]